MDVTLDGTHDDDAVQVSLPGVEVGFDDVDGPLHGLGCGQDLGKEDQSLVEHVADLLHTLGQALVDWCVENGKQENLWSFSIKVKRVVDGIEDLYIPTFYVKYYSTDNQVVKNLEDESKREGFVGCQDFLFELISEFLERNKRDLPLDWNMFWFGLDDLMSSCKYGVWVSDSDGYMDLASVDDENKENKLYVECM